MIIHLFTGSLLKFDMMVNDGKARVEVEQR